MLRDLGDDFTWVAKGTALKKIYRRANRSSRYQFTHKLGQEIKPDLSGMPQQITIVAHMPYAGYVEYASGYKDGVVKKHRYAGDLSFMTPTFKTMVNGEQGFQSFRDRVIEALREA